MCDNLAVCFGNLATFGWNAGTVCKVQWAGGSEGCNLHTSRRCSHRSLQEVCHRKQAGKLFLFCCLAFSLFLQVAAPSHTVEMESSLVFILTCVPSHSTGLLLTLKYMLMWHRSKRTSLYPYKTFSGLWSYCVRWGCGYRIYFSFDSSVTWWIGEESSLSFSSNHTSLQHLLVS